MMHTYTVYILNNDESLTFVAEYATYEAALNHAKRIATKPVYNVPDPDGVYVLIYDDYHDSPRYTSW